MTSPSKERPDQIRRLLSEAVALDPDERAAFLAEACGSDDALRAELASLLARDEEASAYFEDFGQAVRPFDPPAADETPFPSAPDEPDALAGQRVTHYEIVEQLGRGGMGVVYKAKDLLLDRLVALKFLPPHLSADEAAQARFVHEAKAASALDHVHIGCVHEIGQASDGRLFIAMTYYQGETLKDKVERGPLPLSEALRYATEMADGLACAHKAGIVHRDVKPANVMVAESASAEAGSGAVKLVDFGLAKAHDLSLTQTGMTMGTVNYMSPEQARGDAVDHRADVWALGVVLYELLTGERPFQGVYEQAVLYAVLNEEPTPPSAINPDVPAALDDVVASCLRKDPAERYQHMTELLADLEQVQRGDGRVIAPPSAVRRAGRLLLHDTTWQRLRRIGAKPVMALAAMGIALVLSLNWLSADRLPEARHLAVLPFQVIGEEADAEAFSAGLLESLTSKLTQLEQFHGALWVVPASEVGGPMRPSEAREQLGVTMVVTGSAQFEERRVRLTLNLIDATTQRQISSEQIDSRTASALALQDEALLALARMLQVTLQPQARQMLTAGGTAEPQANEFYLRGQGYLRQHQSLPELETAIQLFETAIEKDSLFALAYAGLGEAYWSKYRLTDDLQWTEPAREHSQRALALDDRLAPVYVTLGVIHSGRGEYEAALKDFQHALEIDPFSAEAYRRRAIVYRQQGRLDEAEETYRHAIALKPDYWRGYNSLGVLYYMTGRYEEAVAQYAHGLRLAPANQRLLSNMGAAYWQMERLGEAIETFERVLQIDSTNPTATSNLATAYFYQGRFEDAARLYEKELTMHPHDYGVQGFLADAYYWTPGKRDQAEQAYRKAIAMTREHLALKGEQDLGLLGSLATHYARLGAPDTARVFLKQIEAALQPEEADVVTAFGVGEAYEQLGDRTRARAWMESALQQGYGWIQLQYSPWLDDLRRDAEIQALIAEHRSKD